MDSMKTPTLILMKVIEILSGRGKYMLRMNTDNFKMNKDDIMNSKQKEVNVEG